MDILYVAEIQRSRKINAIYFVTGGELCSKLDSMDLVQDAFVLALQDEEAEPLLLEAIKDRHPKFDDKHPAHIGIYKRPSPSTNPGTSRNRPTSGE